MFIAGFPAGSLAANCYLLAPAAVPAASSRPGENALEGVMATVEEHGLQPLAVVLTHGHLDHAAALRDVTATYGIPATSTRPTTTCSTMPLSALSPEFRQMLAGYPLPQMRPDELRGLAPDDVLTIGDLTLSIVHTPGHTGGSVLVKLAGDADRPDILFTGDTLFAGSVGRTDLPGGSTAELNASLIRGVLTQSDDAVVLPGHGPQSTIGAERQVNPFLLPLISADPGAR